MTQERAKYSIRKALSQGGIFVDGADIWENNVFKIVVENAGASNQIQLLGKIVGEETYHVIDTITGNGQKQVDIQYYDLLQLNCTVYDCPSNYLKVTGSAFYGTTVNVGDVTIAEVALDTDTMNQFQSIQDTSNVILDDIKTNTTGLATEVTQLDVLSALQTINNTQITLNIKEQILRAVDREQTLSYAEFGTKNQRITQMDYVSASIANKIARKTFSYVLDGNSYRMTDITWEIIDI